MPKVTLDMNTFKALASDTRLTILKALDGKKLSLKDICKATKLNKATLHEHLTKLNQAGLVKRNEREGHKWVFYNLTWKGEGLLHPENTRIVVMFTATFIIFAVGILQLINYVKGKIVAKAVNFYGSDSTAIYAAHGSGSTFLSRGTDFAQAPIANVPLENQTLQILSKNVAENLKLKGVLGQTISTDSIAWESECSNLAYNAPKVLLNSGGDVVCDGIIKSGGTENAFDAPATMFAVVHDPAIQYIAVICIVIFGILIGLSIWRYRKNRKTSL